MCKRENRLWTSIHVCISWGSNPGPMDVNPLQKINNVNTNLQSHEKLLLITKKIWIFHDFEQVSGENIFHWFPIVQDEMRWAHNTVNNTKSINEKIQNHNPPPLIKVKKRSELPYFQIPFKKNIKLCKKALVETPMRCLAVLTVWNSSSQCDDRQTSHRRFYQWKVE